MTVKEFYEQCVKLGVENLPLLVEINFIALEDSYVELSFGLIRVDNFDKQVGVYNKYKTPCIAIDATQYNNKIYSCVKNAVIGDAVTHGKEQRK